MRIELYPGVGKAEVEIQRITELASLPNAAALPCFRGRRGLIQLITRQEIESNDLRRLEQGFSRVSCGQMNYLLGRTSFAVAGYEHDARELFEIPEVRSFYTEALNRCPAFLPAADLRNECLRAVVFCVLQNLTIVYRLDTEFRQVHVPRLELEHFFLDRLRAQAVLHKKLGWSRTRGVKALKRLENYLGFHQP